MKDAVIGYLQVASGLTDVTRQRATATAKSLLGDGGLGGASDKVSVGQVQSLAEELVAASKANRELLSGLVRAEVDRAVAALGLATRDDVAALRRQVDRIQHDLDGGKSTTRTKTATAAKKATRPATKKTATTAPRRATKPAAAKSAGAPAARPTAPPVPPASAEPSESAAPTAAAAPATPTASS